MLKTTARKVQRGLWLAICLTILTIGVFALNANAEDGIPDPEIYKGEEVPIGLHGFMVVYENYISPDDSSDEYHKQFFGANFSKVYGNLGGGIKVDSIPQQDFIQIRQSVFLDIGKFEPTIMFSTDSSGADYIVPECAYFWNWQGWESLIDVAYYIGVGGPTDNFIDPFFHTRKKVYWKLWVCLDLFYDFWESGQKQWGIGPGLIWDF